MKLVLTIPHFSPGTGGAEGFAVSVFRELVLRGHELLVVAEDGRPLEGSRLVCGSLDRVAAEAEAFGADLTIDWGLNAPADIHRLGGGTHRQFLNYALQAYPWGWRAFKKLSYALSAKHRRTSRAERQLTTSPRTRFLAVSEFVAAQVRAAAAPIQPKVTVLHNGVDVERFSPERLQEQRASCRAQLGLREDDVAFLFVAHNLRLKNFKLMQAVFGDLRRELPQAKLVLLGKRCPRIRAPWLIYAGSTATPEPYYAAADALLHPTWYDACANVVLEALAAGLPVVSSDRNGSAEVLESGRNGFVLPVAGQAGEVRRNWAQTIGRLSTDQSLRTKLGAAARQLALRHSLKSYVDDLEGLLKATAGMS
jgi:UDP-glucose:(heptosyl)LPS alpha-1,3-glucosyltransferase